MKEDLLKKLKKAGLTSEIEEINDFVHTGIYALNWVISGDISKGS